MRPTKNFRTREKSEHAHAAARFLGQKLLLLTQDFNYRTSIRVDRSKHWEKCMDLRAAGGFLWFLIKFPVLAVVWLVCFPTRWIWWSVLQFFPDGSDINEKVRVLEGNGDAKSTIKAIYGFLGILDSKASALMRYNGIILAVVALMVRSGQELPAITYVIVYTTLASILACLLVVGVFWRFLEFVGADLDGELNVIRRVLIMREAAYQVAWWLAVIVSILLIIHFADFVKVATK